MSLTSGPEDVMAVRADVELCCGSGQCVYLAPTVFGLDDDGLVVVLDSDPEGAELVVADEAVRDCPTRAISLDGS
jgi:ferredoxin